MPTLDSPLVKIAITLGVLYAVHKYGNADMKVAAMGAAGFVIANQIPYVRDGLQVRALAA